jgi:hypothetical protein
LTIMLVLVLARGMTIVFSVGSPLNKLGDISATWRMKVRVLRVATVLDSARFQTEPA